MACVAIVMWWTEIDYYNGDNYSLQGNQFDVINMHAILL